MEPRQGLSIIPLLTYVVLPTLIPITLIACRPSRTLRLSAFFVYSLLCVKGPTFTTHDKHQDYVVGSTIGTLFLTSFSLVWLLDPVTEYRHERDSLKPAEMGLIKRLYWSSCLFLNSRGIGWNYRAANIPPAPMLSRWAFVRSRILRFLAYFVLADLLGTYLLHHPVLVALRSNDPNSPTPRIKYQGYFDHKFFALILAFGGRHILSFRVTHSLASAVFVALGVSQPEDWPDMLNSITEAWSVKRFWGVFWHQMFRRHGIALGVSLCQLLGLRKGTTASRYTKLCSAFLISGFIHAAGDIMARPELNPFLHSGPFFALQVVGIVLESRFLDDRQSLSKMRKALGYVWVWVWFCIVSPRWIESNVCVSDWRPDDISVVRLLGAEEVVKRWATSEARVV